MTVVGPLEDSFGPVAGFALHRECANCGKDLNGPDCNCIDSQVPDPCGSEEASKAVPVADERKPSDGDYLRWAEQAGAKVNWDFESTSSARVVFLLASQWGRFCDKVRASQTEPTSKGEARLIFDTVGLIDDVKEAGGEWRGFRGVYVFEPNQLEHLLLLRARRIAAIFAPLASQQRALSDEVVFEIARKFGLIATNDELRHFAAAILAASSGSTP